MSDAKPSLRGILIGVLRTKNTTYSPLIDAARLDAAEALVKYGFAAPDGDTPTHEDLHEEIAEVVYNLARHAERLPDRVRAVKMLFDWGYGRSDT